MSLFAILVGVAVLGGVSPARAGLYHVYGCRTPAGVAAPTDGWSSTLGTGVQLVANTCTDSGALIAEIPSTADAPANLSSATWVYNAPPQTRLFAATLWRSGTATNVLGHSASTTFWLSTPQPTYDQADTFERCVPQSCTSLGDPTDPLGTDNQVFAPAANVQGALMLGAGIECFGADGDVCPESLGGAGPPSGVLDIYGSDIVLDDESVPVLTTVSGGLATDAPLTGSEPVSFTAADAGPGLYQVNFFIDGKLVSTVPVDSNGGRCVPASPAPTDGTNAFFYGQPCDASANVTDTFDTSQVANGTHELLVQVTDASGAAATVLDRKVVFSNGPTAGGGGGPGAGTVLPNGSNASPQATLHVHWRHSAGARLTSQWGQIRRITGTLSTSTGQPIANAAVGVQTLPSYAGAHSTSLGSLTTNAAGVFSLSIPGSASSRSLTFSYDTHVGDSRPAATASLTLLVHAGMRFSVSPHVTAVGHVITFDGTMHGTPIPVGGKQIVLEARAPGSAWIEFQVIRTNAKGRFSAQYRFRFAGPATYQFRAVSEFEADFPFLGGASNIVQVFER